MKSENVNNVSKANGSQQFALQKIYLKDLSFESPRPIESLNETSERLKVNLNLNSDSRQAGKDMYEVVLTVTVTADFEKKDDTLYLIEVKQAGLFGLKGFSDEELNAVLHATCPNILYPYARETVSTIVERGGFPQLLLKPMNFDTLLEKQMQDRAVKA